MLADDVLANVTTAGWGKWHDSSKETCELNELNVQILDPKHCNNFKPGSSNTSRICAGLKTSLKGPCPGDSGGPLMRLMSNGRFANIGKLLRGSGTQITQNNKNKCLRMQ